MSGAQCVCGMWDGIVHSEGCKVRVVFHDISDGLIECLVRFAVVVLYGAADHSRHRPLSQHVQQRSATSIRPSEHTHHLSRGEVASHVFQQRLVQLVDVRQVAPLQQSSGLKLVDCHTLTEQLGKVLRSSGCHQLVQLTLIPAGHVLPRHILSTRVQQCSDLLVGQ